MKITETLPDASAADAKSPDADEANPMTTMPVGDRVDRLRAALEIRRLSVDPPIFESVSIIVSILVGWTPTKNPDNDADDLGDMADISYGLAKTVVNYLLSGKPRPGVLITELLTVKNNQFLKSPVGKAAMSASLTPASPAGSDANAALV